MILFRDKAQIGNSKTTKEGYLVATSRIARMGIQKYKASELGDVAISAGWAPDDIVKVYRPEEEVFSDKTMQSLSRVPITINHPKEAVTADNWSEYAVGEVGDTVARDGSWLVVNPMLKDAEAIRVAKTSHKEFSLGYTANLVKARDGVDADFEMQDIRVNHLSLVGRARAGKEARLTNDKGITMSNEMELKTIVLNDQAVQIVAEDAAAVEQFKNKVAEIIAAKDGEIGELKASLEVAKKQIADIDVDALVAERVALVGQVKQIDDSIEVDGLSAAGIKLAAVKSVLGEEIVKDASADEINGMFKAILNTKQTNNNQVVKDNQVAKVLSVKVKANDASPEQEALAKSITDLNAWRNQA